MRSASFLCQTSAGTRPRGHGSREVWYKHDFLIDVGYSDCPLFLCWRWSFSSFEDGVCPSRPSRGAGGVKPRFSCDVGRTPPSHQRFAVPFFLAYIATEADETAESFLRPVRSSFCSVWLPSFTWLRARSVPLGLLGDLTLLS